MKNIFYILLLLPTIIFAQYPNNSGHKITLGEQTTADGLIYRGVASIDTLTATNKITRANKQDTSVYILLDTVTNLLWHYKTASNGWLQAGGSTFDTTSIKYVNTYGTQTINGAKTFTNNGRFSANLNVNNYLEIGSTQNINSYVRVTDGFVITKMQSLNSSSIAYIGTESNHSIVFLANNTPVLHVTSGGKVGVGSQFPTAFFEIKSGTAAQYTAPLKFTSGTNLTTPELGAMEFSLFNGANRLFITPQSGVRKEIGYADLSNVSGVLPVVNGGTNASTFTSGSVVFAGASGTYTQDNSSLFYDNTNDRLGIGTSSPKFLLSLYTSAHPQDSLGFTTYNTGGVAGGRQPGGLKIVSKTNGGVFGIQNLDATGFSGLEYINNLSNIGVFTGFSNSNSEYRVNNIAANGFINFLIDGNSELYVKNNGNIGLSTDNPSEALHVVGNARITAMNAIGDIGANANGVLQAATSDMNLKNTIENSPFGLNEILLLNPVTFLYNDINRKLDSDVKEVGFIAQDVFDIIPNAVSSTGTGDLQLDYRAITATLVKAIQEQQALIKALEQRIINLENK
jgi:hypothetical protein